MPYFVTTRQSEFIYGFGYDVDEALEDALDANDIPESEAILLTCTLDAAEEYLTSNMSRWSRFKMNYNGELDIASNV